MIKSLKLVLVLISYTCLTSTILFAQSVNEVAKIIASDRAAGDEFGDNIAMSGDYAIVGALSQDTDAANSNYMAYAGAAYIYKKNSVGNWLQIKKLVASDRDIDDYFGASVAISGNYAVVGAIYNDEDETGTNFISEAGAAYIFHKDEGGIDNWGEVQKIVPSDRAFQDLFGDNISMYGDYLIVGVPNEDEDTSNMNTLASAGSAYIFKRDVNSSTNQWIQIKKLVASDRAYDDRFGYRVAVFKDYAVVSALYEDENSNGNSTKTSAGSAYIFKKDEGGIDNWGETQKIVASDRNFNDHFGRSLAISDDYIIVGAANEDEDATGNNNLSAAGSVYIFKKNTGGSNNWSLIKKIVASDRDVDDYFGISVAISENYVIVGADLEDEDAAGNNYLFKSGSAYVFKQNEGGIDNWGEIQKIVASDRKVEDEFGSSVAMSGDYAIVGAPLHGQDTTGFNPRQHAGAAYIFKITHAVSTLNLLDKDEEPIEVFPNPVYDYLNIKNGKGLATLYNIIGQPIRQFLITESQTQISTIDLVKGSYFLVIERKNKNPVSFIIVK
jgi:hypothetical protein